MDVTVTPLCSKGRRLRGIQKHGRTVRGRLFVQADDDEEFLAACMAVLQRDDGDPMVLHGAELVPDTITSCLLLRGYEFLEGRTAERHAVVQEWRIDNIDLGEVMKSAAKCWKLEAQLKAIHEARHKTERGVLAGTADAAGGS